MRRLAVQAGSKTSGFPAVKQNSKLRITWGLGAASFVLRQGQLGPKKPIILVGAGGRT